MKISLQPPSPCASWPTRLLGCCLLSLLALCAGVEAHATEGDTFLYKGIYYQVLEGDETVMTKPCQKRKPSIIGEIEVNGNPYAKGDIVIPSTVYDTAGKAYTVVGIGVGSFGLLVSSKPSAYQLTSVTLPPTVTVISEHAFSNQTKLATVYGGEGVPELGPYAFFQSGLKDITNFSNLRTVGDYALEGTNISYIPETITSIGKGAFSRCIWLTSVVFNPELSIIPNGAFSLCRNLESVQLPDGLKEIGNWAFAYDSKLEKILLPESLEILQDGVFHGSGLKAISIPANTVLDTSVFADCASLTDVELPANLNELPNGTFENCTALESVTLPENVSGIGSNAFKGCTAIKEMIMEGNISSIGDNAFEGCTSLYHMVIGDKVTSIGAYAFKGCTSLSEGIIGPNVESVGTGLFVDCTSLIKIAVPNKLQSSVGIPLHTNALKLVYPDDCVVENECVYSAEKYRLYFISLFTKGRYEIPNHVVSVEMKAGYGCKDITELIIGKEKKKIDGQAFADCTGLRSVTIDSRDQQLVFNSQVFSGCTAIEKVTVPTIKDWLLCSFGYEGSNPLAFCGHLYLQTQELTDLVIPEGTEEIGSYQFQGGKEIKSVSLPESLTYIKPFAFRDCIGLKDVTVPESVTDISQGAFYGCTGLEHIALPGNLRAISSDCFYDCKSLAEITLGENVESIGNRSFANCSRLENLTVKMPLPWTAPDAFDYIFYQCTLTAPAEYVIDYAITEPWSNIRNLACPEGKVGLAEVSGLRYVYNTVNNTAAVRKYDYSSLSDVEIPARINQSGVFCNVIRMAEGAFEGNESLRTLSIGRNLESLPKKAFKGCPNLQSVTFNENSVVRTVGDQAFEECASMTECLLPQTVVEIGWRAFGGCSSLEKAIVGDGVRYIASQTFMDCSSLKEATIGNAVEWIDNSAFQGCVSLTDIRFGGGLKALYPDSFRDCSSLTSLTLPPALEWIGAGAFACENGKLKEVKMGFSLANLYDKVFEGQTGLSDIYITRDTPPSAYATTFSNYKATLHVVPGTVEAYSEAAPCWFNFYDNGNVKEMVPVQEVKLSETSFDSPKPGDTFKLSATVSPADATMTEVYWVSTNPRVATVTTDGVVTIQDTFAAPVSFVAYDGEDWDEPNDSYCEIRAYSMFGNVPEAVCTIGDPSGVEEIPDGFGADRFDATLPYEVYTLQGAFVGRSLDNLAGGFYILRQGRHVRKVMLGR